MWRKGDWIKTAGHDITEIVYDDRDYEDMEKTRLVVETEDADYIIFQLNKLLLLENFLENEDKHLEKIIEDPKIEPLLREETIQKRYVTLYLLEQWRYIMAEARENGVLSE